MRRRSLSYVMNEQCHMARYDIGHGSKPNFTSMFNNMNKVINSINLPKLISSYSDQKPPYNQRFFVRMILLRNHLQPDGHKIEKGTSYGE